MKKYLAILFLIYNLTFIIHHSCKCQNPLIKQWDKRFGGTDNDFLTWCEKTTDQGYISGGYSMSQSSGDKTQNPFGIHDYWIVKTDDAGNKLWDKNFGAADDDQLKVVHQTKDGGYILGGYSNSAISGDKTQQTYGQYDFWIVKTDSLGNKLWDKCYGGREDDVLCSMEQTKDSGYILGGFSVSNMGGAKTQNSWGGYDYWIVKIDSLGIIMWDKDFGGLGFDKLYAVHQTADGGFILGGQSNSEISGDKTQPNRDTTNVTVDYWMIKTDSIGNKLWDKVFGGTGYDWGYTVDQTNDNGYILGGHSNSSVSGDKSQPALNGTDDYWIVKTDSGGIKQWDRDYTAFGAEEFEGNIIQTHEGGYLLSGTSYSFAGGDKTEANLGMEQAWIIKTDFLGNVQWDKTIFSPGHSEASITIEADSACYVIAITDNGDVGGYKSQPPWNNSFDYWIIKFCDSTLTTSITQLPGTPVPFSIYPNPAGEFITINTNLITGKEIRVTDTLGKLLLTKKIKVSESNVKIQISTLARGIYFIKAGNEIRKFVKE